ncbi:MAG: aminotransferase class I/II-fold pyridoxal phosphate-dependent enzyme [Eubacteriales bacterium]
MADLWEQLELYAQSDKYPFHMPGHKRNEELVARSKCYQLDLTEIEGFDNLHDPQTIFREAMEEAAVLYHAKKSYFLVNGSTCGILTAMSAITQLGDEIIIARNSHKAIYHGAMLRNLGLVYAYPTYLDEYDINGSIEPEQIQELLEAHPKVKTVIITSPTMQGIVSDVKHIASICHQYGVPLIVDEAHGAHFGLTKESLPNSNQLGADLVIQSLHKTLPSLTQTAMLHLNGELVSNHVVEQYLSIYQTSSPSYLLLGSVIRCNELMKYEKEMRIALLQQYAKTLEEAGNNLQWIRIFSQEDARRVGCYGRDIGKIIISVKHAHFTGKQLYDILISDYGLQMEMAAETYVLAIVTGYDTMEGIERLIAALRAIDQSITGVNSEDSKKSMSAYLTSKEMKATMSIYDAMQLEKQYKAIQHSCGCISAGYVMIYPPGVPVLVPGEMITAECCEWIQLCIQQEMNIQGLTDDKEIAVISIII